VRFVKKETKAASTQRDVLHTIP